MIDDLVISLGSKHPYPCPKCGGSLLLRDDGKFGPYYGCNNYPRCRGSANAHGDGRPMGKPAGEKEKLMRILAHALLDKNEKTFEFTRKDTYAWLKEIFKREDPHISDLDENELRFLIKKIQERMRQTC